MLRLHGGFRKERAKRVQDAVSRASVNISRRVGFSLERNEQGKVQGGGEIDG